VSHNGFFEKHRCAVPPGDRLYLIGDYVALELLFLRENMTPAARLVVSLVAVASFGDAIRAQPCDRFDVASIKVNTNGGGGSYPELGPGGRRVVATNQYLMALLMFAYDVSPCRSRVFPAPFSRKVRYRGDVRRAHDEGATPSSASSLLEERFNLSIHRELKEQPVYALIVGKGGSRLRETTHGSDQPGFTQVGHSFTFTNATIANLIAYCLRWPTQGSGQNRTQRLIRFHAELRSG